MLKIIEKFLLLGLCAAVASCGGGSGSSNPANDPPPTEPPPAEEMLQAEIRMTEYGIPHVSATDWASLGYGHGYVYAMHNYCVLMREVVVSNGQSQRYFGDDGDLARDFVFALLGGDIDSAFLGELETSDRGILEGYVAGFNRYLADTGVGNLAEGEEGCRDEPWVREISLQDLGRLLRKVAVRASTDPLASFIFAARGPDAVAASTTHTGPSAQQLRLPSAQTLAEGIAAIDLPRPEQLGSNAYAVGSQASLNNRGVLFGNPHFPWQGASRFSMVHLTMTSDGTSVPEYDVAGAALHGFPLVSIGFNNNVGWSHTVSTGSRFVLYELQLNPDDPMQYEYEGEMRDITTQSVTFDVQLVGGAIGQQEHTFYFSHFGPIVNLGAVNALLDGWPIAAGTGTVYAVRDINADNTRGLATWRQMGQASNIAELQTALQNIGIPWVNTIAADRDGQTFYGDISAVANVSDAQAAQCISGPIAPLLTDFGLTTLDGSLAACELGEDDDAPQPGIIGFANLPSLSNTSYVANANDSYWLANPDDLLTGFPAIIGGEEIPQSLRTRLTFAQMQQRLAGSDGLGQPGVSPELLQDMLFSSRNMAAELVLDDVRAMCAAVPDWSVYSSQPASMAQACTVLAGWDGRHNNDSVGGHVFYEFWRRLNDHEALWEVAFDPADPVDTPHTLNLGNASLLQAARQALADGVQNLLDNNIALDAAWGSVQFSERNGQRIPIHGGSGSMLFSVITSSLVPDEGYSAIRHGNSYMQTVGWNDGDCPDAFALLSYSQSTDPASDHYADQTQLYSDKQWVDMAYCEQDVSSGQVGETIMLEQARNP